MTISMGIQGPVIDIPVVVVDMNETELKSRKPRVLKSSPFSRFILLVCLIVKKPVLISRLINTSIFHACFETIKCGNIAN